MKKRLSEKETAFLMVLSALIVGGLMRFTPPALAGFPVNDGGLFTTMISDLGNSHYSLPAFTTYNGSTIPFAYPPFGLYLARVLIDLFHFPVFEILRWLPALVSVLAILAFYAFASEMLESRIQAGLATVLFAISPRSFSWFVMGGGLTRVFGMLGLLLTLYGARKLFKEPSPKMLAFTIVAGTFTVLSHPEAIVHTVAAAGLLWLTTARNKKAFLSALQVAFGVLLCTAPWWATVLYQHGPTPLLNASQTGFPFLFFAVIPFYFTEETMLTWIAVLGIIGLFAEINRRNYFLPAWVFVSFLVQARSAAWVANIALVLMAAIALDKIILPGLAAIKNQPAQTNYKPAIYSNPVARILLGYIFLYLMGTTYLYSLAEATVHLSEKDREAMTWVQENTPVNSRFLLLTPGSDYPMRDPIQEWFPSLTERISLTTFQGREWTLGPKFADAFTTYRELQSCATQQEVECIFKKMPEPDLTFNYLYINKKSDYQLGATWPKTPYNPDFVKSAQASGQFSIVYENETTIILEVKK